MNSLFRCTGVVLLSIVLCMMPAAASGSNPINESSSVSFNPSDYFPSRMNFCMFPPYSPPEIGISELPDYIPFTIGISELPDYSPYKVRFAELPGNSYPQIHISEIPAFTMPGTAVSELDEFTPFAGDIPRRTDLGNLEKWLADLSRL